MARLDKRVRLDWFKRRRKFLRSGVLVYGCYELSIWFDCLGRVLQNQESFMMRKPLKSLLQLPHGAVGCILGRDT